MTRTHKIDELVRKLYHCSDDDLNRELEEAMAEAEAGRVPKEYLISAPGEFDRLWGKIEAQEKEKRLRRKKSGNKRNKRQGS